MSKEASPDIYEQFAQKALTYLNSTEAFLKEQLPDYFQQVVTYHAIQAWVYVGLGLIALPVGLYCIHMVNREESKGYKEADGAKQTVGVIVAIICAFLLLNGCFNVSTAFKATLAPKVFIVDYLRGKE